MIAVIIMTIAIEITIALVSEEKHCTFYTTSCTKFIAHEHIPVLAVIDNRKNDSGTSSTP